MDTPQLTIFCCSSSPLVGIEMERVTTQQVWVWSNDSYSSDIVLRSKIPILPPPLILVCGPTKKKMEKSSSSSELISFCGIILSLVILNLVIILQDFCSSFYCMVSIFKSFLRILSCIWTAWSVTATAKHPIDKSCTDNNNINVAGQIKLTRHQTETDDHLNLALLDMKKMIEGVSLSNLGSCETQENIGGDKIAGLFEEEEPSLMEVKEAFDIFDENKDGFIDAKDLGNALFLLGFMEASEEDCKRMIQGFDDNLDGRIDFHEFIKVLERSLS